MFQKTQDFWNVMLRHYVYAYSPHVLMNCTASIFRGRSPELEFFPPNMKALDPY
jgi:hypothetical protein